MPLVMNEKCKSVSIHVRRISKHLDTDKHSNSGTIEIFQLKDQTAIALISTKIGLSFIPANSSKTINILGMT